MAFSRNIVRVCNKRYYRVLIMALLVVLVIAQVVEVVLLFKMVKG